MCISIVFGLGLLRGRDSRKDKIRFASLAAGDVSSSVLGHSMVWLVMFEFSHADE